MNRRTVSVSFAGLAFARLASIGASFVVTPTVIDHLGVGLFGVWAVFGSSLSLVYLADLGLGQALTRAAAIHNVEGDVRGLGRVVALSIAFYAALGVVLTPVVWLASPWLVSLLHVPSAHRAEAMLTLVAMFALAFFGTALNSYSLIPIGAGRLEVSSAVAAVAAVVNAFLAFTLLRAGWSLPALVVGTAASVVLSSTLSWVVAHHLEPGLRLTFRGFDAKWLRGLAGYGANLQATTIAGLVNAEADRLIIGSVAGVSFVTPYEISNRLAGLIRLVPGMAFSALFPYTTQAHARGDDPHIRQLYERGTAQVSVVVGGMVAYYVVAGSRVVHAWIGQDLGSTWWILPALVVSYGLNQLTGIGTTISRAIGKPGYETAYTVLSVILNIGLTLLLIPTIGAYGTVIATVAATVVSSAYFFAVFHRARDYPIGAVGRPVLLVIAAGTLAAVAVRPVLASQPVDSPRWIEFVMLAASGALFSVVYLGLLLPLGFWTRQELAWAKRTSRLAWKRAIRVFARTA